MTLEPAAAAAPPCDREASAELSVERAGVVLRLRLNRPARANGLNALVVNRMADAVAAAARDDTRVLALDGIGRNFCSGFDLSDLDNISEGDLALRFLRIELLLQAIYHAPMRTVAFAQGCAFGAGADLFCACTHRIASPDARFRFPGPRFGVVLGTGRLNRCVGETVAQDLLLGGHEFDAARALQAGLATEIVDPADWPARLAELGRTGDIITAETSAAIFDVLREERRAADLAALARSVAAAGFKQRVLRYRDSWR
ncbi:MAG: enoyl-CoA hydratase/isomerase family protein [Pseudolabrys sp.]